MTRFILIPYGSHGDVHPFTGLGEELRRRGHEVLFFVNGHFAPLMEKLGFPVELFGTDEEFRKATLNPDIWHPTKGFGVVAEGVKEGYLMHLYEQIQKHTRPGRTVLVTSGLALGARVAHEKLGIPLATVHLQPAILRSVHQPPKLPGAPWPAWAPHAYTRLMYWLADLGFVDPILGKPLNAFRAELGLPPVKRFMHAWWHSPQLVVALFPEWFAEPQPDWPPQTVCAGFPLYDERGVEPLPADVAAFLESGSPPIVFTPGSAHRHGRGFFETAAAACALLGRRGMLLSRHRENVPDKLPEGVQHFAYVPFSELLPHAAASVHHGGVGTCAQGLAAGVPQLVWPLAHDQFDNAARLTALGVGDELRPKHFTVPNLVAKLRRLLDDPQVKSRAQALAARIDGKLARERAVDAIERLIPAP